MQLIVNWHDTLHSNYRENSVSNPKFKTYFYFENVQLPYHLACWAKITSIQDLSSSPRLRIMHQNAVLHQNLYNTSLPSIELYIRLMGLPSFTTTSPSLPLYVSISLCVHCPTPSFLIHLYSSQHLKKIMALICSFIYSLIRGLAYRNRKIGAAKDDLPTPPNGSLLWKGVAERKLASRLWLHLSFCFSC